MNIKIKRLLIVIISFISILLLSFLYYKINKIYHIGFNCVFHQITNLYCPGCGITRAIFSLIELDIIGAIKYNILIITVIPLIVINYIVKIINWINLKAQKEMLGTKLYNAGNYFNEIHQKEIEEKVLELKLAQKESDEKVFKYNNSIEEKTQRYQNQIIRNNAELKLQFMEIRSGDYTKTELIDMGYYTDVLKCVDGYYQTLSPSDAYLEICRESKLMIYLDEYYEQLVYVYSLRA